MSDVEFVKNKLLSVLPREDRDQIASDLEFVELSLGQKLADRGGRIDYVYFMIDGIGSVVVTTPNGHRTEAGIFGFDGYIPTSAIAGVEISPHDVEVIVPGRAYRMPYDRFRVWMGVNRNLAKVMIRSIESFSVQLAYTITSNAVHDVNTRLARWLLMCHDRVIGDEIVLTQDFMAAMLSVRRSSVTNALHVLEGLGLIRSRRGLVVIRNRAGLVEFAHDAYGEPEREFDRLMSGLFD